MQNLQKIGNSANPLLAGFYSYPQCLKLQISTVHRARKVIKYYVGKMASGVTETIYSGFASSRKRGMEK